MNPRSRDMFLVMAIICLGFAVLADQGRVPDALQSLKYYAFATGVIVAVMLILERMFRDKE